MVRSMVRSIHDKGWPVAAMVAHISGEGQEAGYRKNTSFLLVLCVSSFHLGKRFCTGG